MSILNKHQVISQTSNTIRNIAENRRIFDKAYDKAYDAGYHMLLALKDNTLLANRGGWFCIKLINSNGTPIGYYYISYVEFENIINSVREHTSTENSIQDELWNKFIQWTERIKHMQPTFKFNIGGELYSFEYI